MMQQLTFKAKEFDELTTRELYEIARARTEIFLMEQHIVCRDLDGEDYRALHCFLEAENGTVMAYLRAMRSKEDAETVQIGRVLSLTHGVGLGKRLMQLSLPEIRERRPCKRLLLHAQTHAKGFYEKWGFAVTSAEFLEEGVPHVTMERMM
jgi:ElaA protein